jgi:hypothetical protein
MASLKWRWHGHTTFAGYRKQKCCLSRKRDNEPHKRSALHMAGILVFCFWQSKLPKSEMPVIMCDNFRNLYVYNTCLRPSEHYFRIRYEGSGKPCSQSPHQRYILCAGQCPQCVRLQQGQGTPKVWIALFYTRTSTTTQRAWAYTIQCTCWQTPISFQGYLSPNNMLPSNWVRSFVPKFCAVKNLYPFFSSSNKE